MGSLNVEKKAILVLLRGFKTDMQDIVLATFS